MATLIGDVDTLDLDSDVLLFDVDEDLHKLQANQAPLALLANRVNSRKTDKPEYKHWEEDLTDPVVNTSTSETSGATTINLDSGDNDRLHAQHLLYVTTTDEVMRVKSVDRGADTVEVERGIGSSTAQAIGNDDAMIVFGPAEKEGADVPERIRPDRTKVNNYVQIFRHAFGVSNTTASTILEAGPDEFERQRDHEIREHVRSIEFAYYFGRKVEDSSGGDVRRMTGGLLEHVTTNVKDMSGSMTESKLDDLLEDVFLDGSGERWLLAGGTLIKDFASFARDNLEIMSGMDETFGISVARYLTAFGPLNVVHDQQLTRHKRPDLGFLIDVQNVRERFLDESRNRVMKMNVQPRGADRTDAEFLSELGVQIINESTHGIITNA